MWIYVWFSQILEFEDVFFSILFHFCKTDYLLRIKGEVLEEKCVCVLFFHMVTRFFLKC